MEDEASCAYFAGSGDGARPLYSYFRALPNGSVVAVDPVRHAESGLCYYPGAECLPGPCCTWTTWVDIGMSNSCNVVTFVQLPVFVACLWALLRWIEQLRRQAERDRDVGRRAPGITERRPPSGTPQRLNTFGAIGGIFASVYVGTAMARITQLSLPVQSRNAMLAIAAFLEPVKDVFQFLEDTTTVKITYAIGTGNYGPIRTIARVGMIGGLATGAVAAVLMTGMAFWSDAMEVIVVPGSSLDSQLFPGCPLLAAPADVVATARTLWLLKVWSWPFQFCSMALTGLLLGARELLLFGCTQVVSSLTYYYIWDLGPGATLELLGWAFLGSQVVFFVACLVILLVDVPLRKKFGLMLPHSTHDYRMDAAVRRQALKDGLLAMCLDLALQSTATIGVYVAGYRGLNVLYQISAVGAAFPEYTVMSDAVAAIVKLAGGAMIGYGMFAEFRMLMMGMVVCGTILGVLSGVAILGFRTELAGGYGSQSCVYASHSACLGIYAGLFGGDSGEPVIFRTFNVLALNASIFCLFTISRAGLYACQDFMFMAQSATAVLPIVFLPGILIACNVFDSAAAVYTACALPTWVLTVIFFVRLQRNSRHMLLGEDGPWLHSLEREAPAAAESQTMMLPTRPC